MLWDRVEIFDQPTTLQGRTNAPADPSRCAKTCVLLARLIKQFQSLSSNRIPTRSKREQRFNVLHRDAKSALRQRKAPTLCNWPVLSHTQEPDPIRTLKSTCGEVHQYWPWRQTGNMRLPIAFCQVHQCAPIRQRSFRDLRPLPCVRGRLRPVARVCNPNAHLHKMACRRIRTHGHRIDRQTLKIGEVYSLLT